MPYYHRLGKIPPKRHTQFRKEDGALYSEELVGSKGFSGIYSLLYHQNPPTQVKYFGDPEYYDSKLAEENPLRHTHLKTSTLGKTGEDFFSARKMLLRNGDVTLGLSNPESHYRLLL